MRDSQKGIDHVCLKAKTEGHASPCPCIATVRCAWDGTSYEYRHCPLRFREAFACMRLIQ